MNKQQKIGWGIVWIITIMVLFQPIIQYGWTGFYIGLASVIVFRLLFSLFFCCSCGEIAFLKHGEEKE